MKTTKPQSINTNRKLKQAGGFTLIEMIGVLAVIAILASLLVPKIFEAINNAKVNNAAVSCSTVKTGLADHYAKFGSIAVNGATTPPTVIAIPSPQASAFDQILLGEGFLDKPFATKIGDGTSGATGTHVELVAAVAAATATTGANDGAYDLDGDATATTANDATGSVVAQAVITGVTALDAKELNDRIDGTSLGSAINVADIKGRVKYIAPVGGVTTVYVYLTHR